MVNIIFVRACMHNVNVSPAIVRAWRYSTSCGLKESLIEDVLTSSILSSKKATAKPQYPRPSSSSNYKKKIITQFAHWEMHIWVIFPHISLYPQTIKMCAPIYTLPGSVAHYGTCNNYNKNTVIQLYTYQILYPSEYFASSLSNSSLCHRLRCWINTSLLKVFLLFFGQSLVSFTCFFVKNSRIISHGSFPS